MTLKRLVNKKKTLCPFQVSNWGVGSTDIYYRLYKSQCNTHRKTDSLFTPAMVGELRKLTAHE